MLRPLFILLLSLTLPVQAAEKVRELTWMEMVPEGAQFQPEPPAPVHDLSQLADTLAMELGSPGPQQSPAEPVVEALDGQLVRLPGYIVPLDVTESGKVPEFLFVPYFGACIHVPPPPSNQIVHVHFGEGVLLDSLYQPFWIEGPLRTQSRSSELAEAGYSMHALSVYPYQQP
jgi:hypothetical protein